MLKFIPTKLLPKRAHWVILKCTINSGENSQGEIGLIVCQERNWIFSRKDNFDQKEALWRI